MNAFAKLVAILSGLYRVLSDTIAPRRACMLAMTRLESVKSAVKSFGPRLVRFMCERAQKSAGLKYAMCMISGLCASASTVEKSFSSRHLMQVDASIVQMSARWRIRRIEMQCRNAQEKKTTRTGLADFLLPQYLGQVSRTIDSHLTERTLKEASAVPQSYRRQSLGQTLPRCRPSMPRRNVYQGLLA